MSGTTSTIYYQLQYRVTGTTTWMNYGEPTTATSEIVIGLSPHLTYDFEVVAFNQYGTRISPITSATTIDVPTTKTINADFLGNGLLNIGAIVKAGTSSLLSGIGSVGVIATTNTLSNIVSGTGQVTVISAIINRATVATAALGAVSANATAKSINNQSAINGAVAVGISATAQNRAVALIIGTSSVFAVPQARTIARATLAGTAAVVVDATVGFAQQWSGTHKYTNIALSNSNLTATEITAAGTSAVYATTSAFNTVTIPNSVTSVIETAFTSNTISLSWAAAAAPTGNPNKFYWEVAITCADPTMITVGIGNINAAIGPNQWVGSNPNSIGWLLGLGVVDSNNLSLTAVTPNPPTNLTQTSVTANSVTLSWSPSNAVGPSAPTNLTQTNITNTSVSLSWGASASSGGQSTWATAPSGSTLCFALDLPNGLLWGRVGNGPWCGNASANPTLGTTGGGLVIPPSVLSAGVVPGCTLNAVGDACVGKFSTGSWTYTAPSGFVSWDTLSFAHPPINVATSNVTSTSLTVTWASS